jgi:fatty acyl-CoA reductase
MSGVADFYAGRSVFVTGATGFIGKVVVEKLLRSCPDVQNVYLLCRAKRGTEPQARIDELMTREVFGRAKHEQPGCEKKVKPIVGDITLPRFGITDADMDTLVNNVTVIIHIAATVKFQEPLKTAALMNIKSVKEIIAIAKSLKECAAFTHTSTAYTHTYRRDTPEDHIKPVHDPEQILTLLDQMDEETTAAICPVLRKQHPNTYTFTKCLAEDLLTNTIGDVPCSVVRPSMVVPAWREPYPGWSDTFNGPTGMMTASGTGLLRVLPGARDKCVDMIPVDIVSNMLVAAGWRTHRQNQDRAQGAPNKITFYNCTSGTFAPQKFGISAVMFNKAWQRYPMEKRMVRSPGVQMYNDAGSMWNRMLFRFMKLMSHKIPGQMMDLASKVTGQKPQVGGVYERLDSIMDGYHFFVNNEFIWANENVRAMITEMGPDHDNFPCDMKGIDWQQYINTMVLGIKKFLLKEDVSERGLAQSRSKYANKNWRGYWIRVALMIATIRSMVTLGYLRASRMSQGSTYVMALALVSVTKRWRAILASDNITV